MCNEGLFCVSEAETRQKLLRTVKKEVGVYSWSSWSRREVYSPQQAESNPHRQPTVSISKISVCLGLDRIVCCVHVCTEFYRRNVQAALIICSAAVRSYLHYLVLFNRPRGELPWIQPLQGGFFQSLSTLEL